MDHSCIAQDLQATTGSFVNSFAGNMPRTGYVFEELYMWHSPGNLPGSEWLEPAEHWENSATKRRLHNLIVVSDLINHLQPLKARKATADEITLFHTKDYHDSILDLSEKEGGNGGEMAHFARGGYKIAALSAGGVLAAVEAVVAGSVRNAYCLVRPPGHHAERDRGMGFCIFNNIAIAALHARRLSISPRIQRIAIVDYDVHHGNGTQSAFWNDPDVLFISTHQASNYPIGAGGIEEVGGEGAQGSNINIPLPPGSGHGAYQYAFESVIIPALDRFRPDLVLVSSGFDASFADNLASMMLSSESYRYFTKQLVAVAERHCDGRIVFAHEGGYSKDYVPFCGLAVIEELSGYKTEVVDHSLEEVKSWGYQELQAHQAAVVDQVALVHGLTTESTPPPGVLLNSKEHSVYLQVKNLLSQVESQDIKASILAAVSK